MGTTTVVGLPEQTLSVADLDETAGPAYRRIALNGRAIPEAIDGQKAESESEKEQSYVDALTLRLQHSVTDIYIPIENSELSLSVRRNLDSEVWNDRSGLRPNERYDRPFGAEWSSNLTPNIHFAYQQPNATGPKVEADYAYVTDEQGYQMRFIILGGLNSTLGAGRRFVPFPSSKMEEATYLAALTDNGGGSFTLTKERGTVLQFHLVDSLSKTIPMDRVDVPAGNVLHQFAAIDRVTDRLGYSLTYQVTDHLTPTRIDANSGDASKGQSITLTTDGEGHVLTAKDNNGNLVNYGYIAARVLDGNEGQVLNTVTHPPDNQGNSPVEQYGYGGIKEDDSRTTTSTPTDWYHKMFSIGSGGWSVFSPVISELRRATNPPSASNARSSSSTVWWSISRISSGV